MFGQNKAEKAAEEKAKKEAEAARAKKAKAAAAAAQGGEPTGSSGSSLLVLGVGFVLSVAVFALVFGGKKTAAVATKGIKGKK